MSRQFDEYMEHKFEYQGELKSLIEPTSFPELVSALSVRDTLQAIIDFALREEDTSGYEELKERQNDYIQEYLNSIGDFDNRILISNIAFLAKSNGIRLGELEKMLGISAGYISRTAKENTGKRLLSQTITDEIEWGCEGGYICDCSPLLLSLPIFLMEDDGTVVYHPEHMNQNYKWELAGDVYSCDTISEGQKLVIIAFQSEDVKGCFYDFIFCTRNEDGTYSWKRAFHTNDPFSPLDERAADLYAQIFKKLDAVRIAPDIRSIVQAYLH